MARSLIVIGLVITALGVVLAMSERLNLPFGRLPGDFVWRGKNTTFYFPLATSILASVVLTLLMWLFNRR